MRLWEVEDTVKVTTKDASDIFGGEAKYVTYTHQASDGMLRIVTGHGKIRDASIIDLFVPEEHRGKGIGKMLLKRVMQDYPSIMGQVSSKAAAKNAYDQGRRPHGQPDATLDDVFDIIDRESSVNLLSPEES